MAGYGYSNVTDKGFTSFLSELSDGEWKGISIKKYDAPDQVPSSPLLDAPRTVVWKLRATWAIGGVMEAIGSASPGLLARLDAEWDSGQRANTCRSAQAEPGTGAVRPGGGCDRMPFALPDPRNRCRSRVRRGPRLKDCVRSMG